jgi:hypothetical protein
MEWFREKQANSETEPVLLAAEFHYRFIRIHPFDDGNGRTARLLMNFILMQYYYPPVIIKTEDKENYFNVLRLADVGNVEPFVNYIAENLSHSLTIMIKGAKGESIEEPDDLDKEIALLEQKLKGVGNRVERAKSKETILEFYDKSFVKLAINFLNSSVKFDTFYGEIEADFAIDSVTHKLRTAYRNTKDTFQTFDNLLYRDTEKIILSCNYTIFKQNKIDAFGYRNFLSISFQSTDYSISIDNSILLTKPYSEQLTDEEISLIVNTEMKRHTAFIEDKIKEIQAQ